MAWQVQLLGDRDDLAALAESQVGIDLTIRQEGEGYDLLSDQFAPDDEARTVLDKAQKMVEMLSGAARLALGAREAIRVGNIYRRRPDGKRDLFLFAEPGVFHVRMGVPTVTVTRADGTVEVLRAADPVRTWMPIALSDEGVGKVLRILASGTLDWVNLYRVFEIAAADVGGLDAAADKGWATKAAMRLFKHTANSPGALGLEARHGAESTDPPAKPMTISEARALIEAIVHAWLRDRVGR